MILKLFSLITIQINKGAFFGDLDMSLQSVIGKIPAYKIKNDVHCKYMYGIQYRCNNIFTMQEKKTKWSSLHKVHSCGKTLHT